MLTRPKILAAVLVIFLFLSGCTLLNALKKPDVSPGNGGSTVVVTPAPPPANGTNASSNGTLANGTGAINGTGNIFIPKPNQTAGNMSANQTANATNATAPPKPMRPRRLEMTFYNVSFGDATLVRTDNLTFLIDTGTVDSADALVRDLRNAQIDRLDAVVITDWEPGKTGGLQSLLDRFVIGEVWAPGAIPGTPAYAGLNASLAQADIPLKTLNAASRINYSDLRLEILNPPAVPYSTSNDVNSMVIRLYYGRFCVFLPSDIQSEQETLLTGSLGTDTCEVYKWPYHGRGRPGASLLVDRLKPSEVIISTGPNDAGLPSPTTLERLRIAGIRTWRTDVNGSIYLYANLNQTYSIGTNATAPD